MKKHQRRKRVTSPVKVGKPDPTRWPRYVWTNDDMETSKEAVDQEKPGA